MWYFRLEKKKSTLKAAARHSGSNVAQFGQLRIKETYR